MKVCIIGTGNQGTGMAGLLAQEKDCEKLVLLDIIEEKAQKAKELVMSLGDRNYCSDIEVHQCDANDIDTLAEYAKECDMIFNAMFAALNYPVMRAALKAGCHYMDLRSNVMEAEGVPYRDTIDAQLDMNDEYAAAGLTAIPCIGLSPGWANIAANYMIEEMDEVEKVIFRDIDYIDSNELIAPINPRNIFYLWLGPPYPTVLVDGEPKGLSLLEGQEEYTFPEPAGKQKIYTFAQDPDIILVNKFASKKVPYIEAKMGISMGGMDMKDMWLTCMHRATTKYTSTEDMFDTFGESLLYDTNFKRFIDEGIMKEGMLAGSVEVTGTKDGIPIQHTMTHAVTATEAMKHIPWAAHNVYGTIGSVCIELVLMVCRGEYTKRGVINCAELYTEKEKWDKKIIDRGVMLSEKILTGVGLF